MDTAFSLLPLRDASCRVGLMGGSFNPPHYGHLQISLEAIKRLSLNYIIWLVTPQNPLKSLKVKGTLAERVALCKRLVNSHPKIKVSSIEANFSTNYTADTIKRLKQMHPNVEFVWIMGMDIVANFDKWQRWDSILEMVPIAIFDRDNDIFPALKSKAVGCQAKFINNIDRNSSYRIKPQIELLHTRKHPISSTNLRSDLTHGQKTYSKN